MGAGPLEVAGPTGPHLVPPFWSGLVLVAHSPRSQYDALRAALGSAGPPRRNLACVALAGDDFHGQQGRPWAAAAGNLHLSAVIACDLPAAGFAPIMPALAAVATAETVAGFVGGSCRPGLKWVNDVLVGDAKIAGSLTSVRTRAGRLEAVTLGIGLNVAVAPGLAPGAWSLPATSLGQLLPGRTPTLESVLLVLLEAVAVRFEELAANGPAGLLAAYRQWSAVIGREVMVRDEGAAADDPGLTGVVREIGPDLALHLVGREEPVTAGRLSLLGPAPGAGTCR